MSISDENPHVPVVAVRYSSTAIRITLDVGGQPTKTIYPPANTFLLQSLDNMTASSTELILRAYDAAGQSSEEFAHVQRSTQTLRNSNDFLLQYYYRPPGGELSDRIVHYFRGVAADITYAGYDIPTAGDRNGRVQHIETEDALFWNNGSVPPGTDPTPYPTVFYESYTMTPSYLPQPTAYNGTQCDPTGRTRQMFNAIYYPDSVGRCDQPAEYSVSYAPNGTFRIDSLDGGNTPGSASNIIGGASLTVTP